MQRLRQRKERASGRVRLFGLAPNGAAAIALLLLFAFSASAQQPLPLQLNSVVIDPSTNSEVVYRIDLDTLPTRPGLVVDATPAVFYEDIQLEVRLENWSGILGGSGACPGPGNFSVETTPSGPVRLVKSLYPCDPDADVFNTAEVDVVIRVLDYGASGPAAKVDISVRGITQVPTNTLIFEVETDLSPQTVSFYPSKDTTIYRADPDSSNGDGTLMWAGAEVEFVGTPTFGFWSRRGLRPLLAFDILDDVPFTAAISQASLRLYSPSVMGSGGGVSLYKVAPSSTGVTWPEGNAQAAGSQFFGASSSTSAATWNARRSNFEDWTTAGGDIEGQLLSSISVTSSSTYVTFSTPALEAAVQSMVDTGQDEDGFLMTGPGTSPLDFSDRGVSFYSREATFLFQRPLLTLTYTPLASWSDGTVNAGTVSFTNEGDNFRWIYDTDQDDILVTDIGGVCEVLPYAPGQQNYFPYTYAYGGPAYTGLDCCTWQIDSAASGTTGTGQALFFHNLDASDPANLPPDADGDGIADLCDNCVNQPNGPLLGTCVGGAAVGVTCNSDLECAAGETCSLSQQDADFDTFGDACPVPEPGFAGGLMMGGALLVALRRRSDARTRSLR